MKAKVIIENNETTIILTPQNDFERDIIEKLNNRKKEFDLFTNIDVEYQYGTFSNHKIEMNIKQTI